MPESSLTPEEYDQHLVALRDRIRAYFDTGEGSVDELVEDARKVFAVADEYREVFRALLAHENGGFLIHCTAGKDRTGFGVAIIQLALGVPRDLVEEDYLLTNDVIDFETFLLPRLRGRYGADVDLDAVRAISGVRLEYIHAALDTVDDHYGSIERYLETIGVGVAERDALKERYLT